MTSYMFESLVVESKEQVMVAAFNRPDKLNAFSPKVMGELNKLLDCVESDDEVKVLVLTGVGEKAFVVGNDLPQLAALDPMGAYEQMVTGQKTFLRIHELSKPVIAMVNGYALGGGFELALACDMVFASTNAKFGFPEINLNTMPGWGGTQLAVKKMGLNRAKEMILSGLFYKSEDCREFGFINRVVSPDELLGATLEFAQTLAAKNSFSIKMAKNAINRGAELDLNAGFFFEAQAYAVNFSAPHAKEGFEAFLNRKTKK
ncbi:enoyl-CoA hydratase/isomerase family protein [Ammoniphilus resinae]|uniref:Enoyl-CoA hydratase/carnithine racemase n=1 Tax=Ammoniphilus resinae TaxID=861532 RepID=A0ABS4GQV3_9BACL|nr:enoyl-CoA hydratase/isomerase family protein [Ammoniphilus resinae]MBP1932644.1 enoyl-CoA hydratase/carnithine racemase [Ammoniphilus resinae]